MAAAANVPVARAAACPLADAGVDTAVLMHGDDGDASFTYCRWWYGCDSGVLGVSGVVGVAGDCCW